VDPDVLIGDGVRLLSHVTLSGRATVGARTVVHPFASLGLLPQNLKYRGKPSLL